MIVHGGWDGGERTQLAEWNGVLARHGYAVAALDYRLAPRCRWPSAREDVTNGVRWLRAHAAELGIAPDNLVLLGRSAGAQNALATAYRLGRGEVRGVVSLYGPADLNFAYAYGTENDTLRSLALSRAYLGGPPESARAFYDDGSPLVQADRDAHPTLLLHGAGDTLVWHRQSERLADRRAALGVPHVFVSLPWATHAFDFDLCGPGGQTSRVTVFRFLDAVTRISEKSSAAEGSAAEL